MTRLFIIGNGYDISRRHGDTRYLEFKKWLMKHYLNVDIDSNHSFDTTYKLNYNDFNNAPSGSVGRFSGLIIFKNKAEQDEFNEKAKYNDYDVKTQTAKILITSMNELNDPEWNQFEENLSRLPIKETIKEFEENNKKGNITKELSLESSVSYETNRITSYGDEIEPLFFEWVDSIEDKVVYEKGFEKKIIKTIQDDDIFIIFNYTETLEGLIDQDKKYRNSFYHIHGTKIVDNKVVGHNCKEKSKFTNLDNEEDYIQELYALLFKRPQDVIKRNKELWDKISAPERLDIYEYGWSCSQVDEDYIKHIVGLRTNKKTTLHLNNHENKGLEKASQWIKYGFKKDHINLYKENDDEITEEKFIKP